MYEVGNLRFYGISPHGLGAPTLFMKGDVHGNLYTSEILTEAQILASWPDAIKYKMIFGSHEFVNH